MEISGAKKTVIYVKDIRLSKRRAPSAGQPIPFLHGGEGIQLHRKPHLC